MAGTPDTGNSVDQRAPSPEPTGSRASSSSSFSDIFYPLDSSSELVVPCLLPPSGRDNKVTVNPNDPFGVGRHVDPARVRLVHTSDMWSDQVEHATLKMLAGQPLHPDGNSTELTPLSER